MSGACYAGDLTGKPLGAPGLAEYYSDVDGVCTKQARCVSSSAAPHRSRRAVAARAVAFASRARFPPRRQNRGIARPTRRHSAIPLHPLRLTDSPLPPPSASSVASRSSPRRLVTVSSSASASSSPCSPPPWCVHRRAPRPPRARRRRAPRSFGFFPVFFAITFGTRLRNTSSAPRRHGVRLKLFPLVSTVGFRPPIIFFSPSPSRARPSLRSLRTIPSSSPPPS